MRVAFDQQVFLLQEYGGISRYICSLAKELARMDSVTAKITAPLHFNRNLSQMGSSPLVFGRLAPKIPKTFRLISTLSTQIAHRAIRKFNPDVIHETYFSTTDFCPKGARRVVTVYDMIHEKFSHGMPFSEITTEAKRATVMRADHVICISDSTRRDLIDLFEVPEDKLSVVHLACDPISPTTAAIARLEANVASPYLLYVGSRGGYKNFAGLLHAYASSPTLKREFSIIAFGGGDFNNEERALIDKLRLADGQVWQLGGGDDVLAALYSKASAFIYPSLYEGFGIPPLEAMSLGCPVIVSDTSSLPEVVGDAGEYFVSDDIDSMRTAIEKVLLSTSRHDELVQLGYKRNAMFSWRRCAEETLSIYRSLA